MAQQATKNDTWPKCVWWFFAALYVVFYVFAVLLLVDGSFPCEDRLGFLWFLDGCHTLVHHPTGLVLIALLFLDLYILQQIYAQKRRPNVEFPKTVRLEAVSLLYAVYLVFLLYALLDDWHLRYVVIVCLTLHFCGLLVSFTIGWDPYQVENRKVYYQALDVVQLIVLKLVASINDVTIAYVGAGVAIVGVITCFYKFRVISTRNTVKLLSVQVEEALKLKATSRPLIF